MLGNYSLKKKIYLASSSLLLLLTFSLVGIGLWSMTIALKELNTKLMETQIQSIEEQIVRENKMLIDGGFADIPTVIKSTKEAVAKRIGESYQFGHSGSITILDQDKKVFFDKVVPINSSFSAPFIQSFYQNKKGSEIIDDQGTSRLIVYSYSPTWNWLIFSAINVSEILSMRTQYLFKVIIAASLLFTFAGFSIWYFIRKILGKILEVRQSLLLLSSKMKTLSQESKDMNNELLDISQAQSSSTQETSVAVEEMNGKILQTTNAAKKSQELTTTIQNMTENATGKLNELNGVMQLIEASNTQLINISNIIDQISKKTTVINDIVFRTQLLSFNASIEAARAGQHGKGFSVVAQEVGNLATLSGTASREISSLLGKSQKEVQSIVGSTIESIKKANSSSQVTFDVFKKMLSSVSEIDQNIGSITNASQEQQLGMQQTITFMNKLSDLSKNEHRIAVRCDENARKVMEADVDLKKTVHMVDQFVSGQFN